MPTRNSRKTNFHARDLKFLKQIKPEAEEWEEENQRNCVLLLNNTQAGIEIRDKFTEFRKGKWR
jgi:hypothetical protein